MDFGSIFSELMQWLALDTGDAAKGTGGVPKLDFLMPETPPSFMQTTQRRPAERSCCTMGQPLPQRPSSLSLDPATLWVNKHKYRNRDETNLPDRLTDGGGTIGYVYTRHGGFIDLGHTRDFIDLTRYFTNRYRDVASLPVLEGSTFLFEENAKIYLEAERLHPKPDHAISALLGAKLAFEYSVWHEINTYFTLQNYSAFAPEDLFSNAVGVVAGFRALFYPELAFDDAADLALKEVLESLGPVNKDVTDSATEYVKGHWWGGLLGTALRRNFLSSGAISPWLVTDLAISGREAEAAELSNAIGKPRAASITIPTHYNGIFLESRARLVFKDPIQKIKDLVPSISEIRSIDLLTVSTKVRDLARNEEGAAIDQP